MKLIKRISSNLSCAVTLVVLGACNSAEAPLELAETYEPEPEIDAATVDPCASQFEFQRALNGIPDDTTVLSSTTQRKTVIKQLYWYADSQTIYYFSYAEGETWCNVSNESGVNWEF